MSISEQIPTYPSLNPTLAPIVLSGNCCWVKEGVHVGALSYLGTEIDPSIHQFKRDVKRLFFP